MRNEVGGRFLRRPKTIAEQSFPNAYFIAFLAILILYFGGWLVLRMGGFHAPYATLMHLLGVRPMKWPFFDLEGVLSWGDCHQRGLDVFRYNPCDPQNRPFNYSPFLLDLPLHWLGTRNTIPSGLAMDGLFLLMLPIVMRPRTGKELGIFVAASLSTAVVYALERGNLDVFEFLLIAGVGLLPQDRQFSRLISYLVYFLGGMIKFYPFALLAMIVRERSRLFILLAFLSVSLIGAFAVHYWSDLIRIPPLLPPFRYFDDTFSADNLSVGAVQYLHLPHSAGMAMLLGMALCAIFAGTQIAKRLRNTITEDSWSLRRFHYLVVASIVLVGCFFLQNNINYRGIFFLLALPGLIELRNSSSLKTMFTMAIAVALFCLWEEFLRTGLGRTLDWISPGYTSASLWDLANVVFFIMRELFWWFEVCVFGGIIICFLLQSPTARRFVKRARVDPWPDPGKSPMILRPIISSNEKEEAMMQTGNSPQRI